MGFIFQYCRKRIDRRQAKWMQSQPAWWTSGKKRWVASELWARTSSRPLRIYLFCGIIITWLRELPLRSALNGLLDRVRAWNFQRRSLQITGGHLCLLAALVEAPTLWLKNWVVGHLEQVACMGNPSFSPATHSYFFLTALLHRLLHAFASLQPSMVILERSKVDGLAAGSEVRHVSPLGFQVRLICEINATWFAGIWGAAWNATNSVRRSCYSNSVYNVLFSCWTKLKSETPGKYSNHLFSQVSVKIAGIVIDIPLQHVSTCLQYFQSLIKL